MRVQLAGKVTALDGQVRWRLVQVMIGGPCEPRSANETVEQGQGSRSMGQEIGDKGSREKVVPGTVVPGTVVVPGMACTRTEQASVERRNAIEEEYIADSRSC